MCNELGVTRAAHHVELLLEFLVSIVDTELLKAVDLKRLKPSEKEQEKRFLLPLLHIFPESISCVWFMGQSEQLRH